jgi:hypothetical protein
MFRSSEMFSARSALVIAAAGLAVAPAYAQHTDASPTRNVRSPEQIEVRLDTAVILNAVVGKRPLASSDDCEQVSSHSYFTDYVNPIGQSVYAQAGVAQGEWTAQTYTLPPGDFPLKINAIETIFATSQSTVETTTRWTVGIWSGTPRSGTLIAQYSSDGTVLPHLIIPPGNAAGIIHFSIDPTHPEQIIVQNDGSNMFSVGFRIDQHNSPPTNACSPANTCCNAFPATDLGPLASPPGNWISAIACPLSCVPGGGWTRFSELVSGCTPSGDWILRARWQPVACAPGIGACCLPNGTCEVMATSNCTAQNGTYQGDGSDCASANCPQPTGACCFSSGSCLNFTQANCTIANGTWLGAGTQCNAGACPTGACCLADGSCAGELTSAACSAQGGTFQGVGSACSGVTCPQPTGACCTASGGCLSLTLADCNVIPNATWKGPQVACSPYVCCYANCTGNSQEPILTVDDFICFINAFAEAQGLSTPQQIEHYANCDASTAPPVLTVDDFICFINEFAGGCP